MAGDKRAFREDVRALVLFLTLPVAGEGLHLCSVCHGQGPTRKEIAHKAWCPLPPVVAAFDASELPASDVDL